MNEIFAESYMGGEEPEDFAAEFGEGSTALYTWGAAISQPVPAVRNLRRHGGFKALGFRRGRKTAFEKFYFGEDTGGSKGDIEPFRFLDLPLEIRWKIYGYLLIHSKPIFVHSDWKTVHPNSQQDHTILRANKQILLESTQFIYEKNVFHAVICTAPALKRDGNFLKREFLPYLRNVMVECEPESRYLPLCNFDMVDAVANCFKILVKSETILNSLTLIISPQKRPVVADANTPITQSTIPSVTNLWRSVVPAIPFTQYFEVPKSEIMKVIPKLRCKVLNIVIRMPEKKKVLVSINLSGLPVNLDNGGWLAVDKTARRSRRMLAEQVKLDLLGLKTRLEDVYEDHEKAIMEGKARLLRDDEKLSGGMKLAYSC
jgi:hypothetical protein